MWDGVLLYRCTGCRARKLQKTGILVAFVWKDETPEHLEELVRREVTKFRILCVRNYLTKSLESLFVRSK